MQPIPIDTESFEKMRTAKEPMLYVDKTAYFHRLITDPQSSNFFLSRPRRFGKSLMISTLEAIFQGRREWFEGLAIGSTDYDWKAHPVIHLDMSLCASASYDDFMLGLPNEVRRALRDAGSSYDSALRPGDNFGNAIDRFYERGTPCVILIDEYDDPVAKALKVPTQAEKARNALSTIYGQLKGRTKKVRFLMITGVSKFTKMSVFSSISNLVDLGDDDAYASMLGYTEAELDANFSEHMARHAALMGLDMPTYRAELRRLFNGYRFWKDEGENVYNPVSINLNLGKPRREFNLYWTKTGRPSMLMNFLERGDIVSLDPESVRGVTESDFDVSDLAHLKAIPMLYQTGYLSIRDYNPLTRRYVLGVPDDEVRQDLALLLTSQTAGEDVSWASRIGGDLLECDWDAFFRGLKSLYAGLPYGSTEESVHEASFTRNLIVLLKSQGFRLSPERVMSDGRIDLVADHPCGTYVFELKVDQPPAIAMSQIERKDYAAPFVAANKPIWLVGLAFERGTRKFVAGLAERYDGESAGTEGVRP